MVLGEVESLEGAFARRAAASSLGLTRYDRRVLWARDIVSCVRVNRLEELIDVVAGRRRKAMVAMTEWEGKGESDGGSGDCVSLTDGEDVVIEPGADSLACDFN